MGGVHASAAPHGEDAGQSDFRARPDASALCARTPLFRTVFSADAPRAPHNTPARRSRPACLPRRSLWRRRAGRVSCRAARRRLSPVSAFLCVLGVLCVEGCAVFAACHGEVRASERRRVQSALARQACRGLTAIRNPQSPCSFIGALRAAIERFRVERIDSGAGMDTIPGGLQGFSPGCKRPLWFGES